MLNQNRLDPEERYRILKPIGRGAMGEVFLASDRKLHRKVALKFLLPSQSEKEGLRKRLKDEACATAALNHPYVCKVYTTGSLNGRTFISMEYLEGETLQSFLKRGPLPLPRAIALIQELSEAVASAHHHGIIHHDLKPTNIMLCDDGHIRVLDFGVASRSPKVTPLPSGVSTEAVSVGLRGTLPYMAPEQLRAFPIDHRADLFSIGVIFLEVLCGIHPFWRTNIESTIMALLNEQPKIPWVLPSRVKRCLRRLLAKNPDERYANAEGLLADLSELQFGTLRVAQLQQLCEFAQRLRRKLRSVLSPLDRMFRWLSKRRDRTIEERLAADVPTILG